MSHDLSYYASLRFTRLKDSHKEKAPSNQLQRLRKVCMWTFGSLVYQINSLYEVLKLIVVAGKTPFFVIVPYSSFLKKVFIFHKICFKVKSVDSDQNFH